MLIPRVLAALVFAPALFAALWSGGPALLWTCVGLACLMQHEAVQMGLRQAPAPLRGLSYAVGLALALGCCGVWTAPPALVLSSVVVAFVLAALRVPGPFAARTEQVARALSLTLYASTLIPTLYAVRCLPGDGRALAVLTVFVPWAADTGAYFAGRAFGRRKLAPSISPAKTLEGAAGGLAFAVAVAVVAKGWLGAATPMGHWCALAALASVFGLLGDLVESLLKRSFGVKDSSRLIPGHGGVLDRFDSVLFASWATYAYSSVLTVCP